MRNTYLQKYFSLSICLIDYALSEINENMRNENRNTRVLRQIPCFFIFKYALFIFYYLVINQYTL